MANINTLEAVARERPFAYKIMLYLIGLKYAISFPFWSKIEQLGQQLTLDLLREKHG